MTPRPCFTACWNWVELLRDVIFGTTIERVIRKGSLPVPMASWEPKEGAPSDAISAVGRAKPDVLIMGAHGRSGVSKALLGSVAEQVLQSLDVDILAVPPAR